MRRYLILLSLLFSLSVSKAQNLDRMSLSSGGGAVDNLNYVLGETFNFTLATGGNIVIETGSLASDENTGIELPDKLGEFVTDNSQISCYPNPVHHLLIVDFNGVEGATGVIVLNELGQAVMQARPNGEKAYLNVCSLSSGGYFLMTLSGNKVLGINKIVKQ